MSFGEEEYGDDEGGEDGEYDDAADDGGAQNQMPPPPPPAEIRGISEASGRLLTWLNSHVDNPDTRGAIPLTLVRVLETEQEEIVYTQRHDLQTDPADTVKALLAAAVSAAKRAFAAGTFLPADFAVKIDGKSDRIQFDLQSNGSRLPVRRVPQAIRRDRLYPDMEGMATLQMEVNVDLYDRLADASTLNLEDKDRTISTLREQLRVSEKAKWRLHAMLEKMLDGSMRRNMAYEQFTREQERKDLYAQGFMNIAPQVAAVALGPEAGKAAALLAAFTSSSGGGAMAELLGGAMGGAAGGGSGGVDPSMFGGGPDMGGGAQINPQILTMALATFEHVDAFIAAIESRKGLFQALLKVLAHAPECVPHLRALHQDSMQRRTAKTQAEQQAQGNGGGFGGFGAPPGPPVGSPGVAPGPGRSQNGMPRGPRNGNGAPRGG